MNDFFPITSRYHNVDVAIHEGSNGKPVIYLRRRFLPQANQLTEIQIHQVTDGERLDHITARYLGDPEQFWRVCDANNAMNPPELTDVPGRTIRITLPEGLTGVAL